MRLGNLKVQIALTIPYGRPNKNGVVYTKEAIEKAITSFEGELPIIYRGNNSVKGGMAVGNTVGETCSVLWDDEQQVCEVIVNGNAYCGGADIIANEIKDGAVTDFRITSVGLSPGRS